MSVPSQSKTTASTFLSMSHRLGPDHGLCPPPRSKVSVRQRTLHLLNLDSTDLKWFGRPSALASIEGREHGLQPLLRSFDHPVQLHKVQRGEARPDRRVSFRRDHVVRPHPVVARRAGRVLAAENSPAFSTFSEKHLGSFISSSRCSGASAFTILRGVSVPADDREPPRQRPPHVLLPSRRLERSRPPPPLTLLARPESHVISPQSVSCPCSACPTRSHAASLGVRRPVADDYESRWDRRRSRSGRPSRRVSSRPRRRAPRAHDLGDLGIDSVP